MTRIRALLRFLWDFVVGDDWRVAAGVAVALALTALLGDGGWWLMPVAVAALLTLSVLSVARSQRPGG